jgi:hypothetical protein
MKSPRASERPLLTWSSVAYRGSWVSAAVVSCLRNRSNRTLNSSERFHATFVCVLVCLSLLLSLNASAFTIYEKSSVKDDVVIQDPLPAPVEGEVLKYLVRWWGIPIGYGQIEIHRGDRNGEPVWNIAAEAKTNEFLSVIYPVHDELKSTVSIDGFYVLESEKNLKEGRYRAHERVTFDYEKGKAYWKSFLNGNTKEIDLPGPVQDVLSAFYWMRLQTFQDGDSVSTTVNTDEKNWNFEVAIEKTQKMEIRNMGVFESFTAVPYARFKGVLVDRGKASVSFTADRNRIPLRIDLKTQYGPVLGIIENIPDQVVSTQTVSSLNDSP